MALALENVSAVPIGSRGNGTWVSVPLIEFSTLVAGMPGTGKSGTLRALLLGASCVPNLCLVGIDLKRVELRPWAPRLTALAVEPADATALLRRLVDLMDKRYEQLEREGHERWSGVPVVAVIDELAEVVASGEQGDQERATLVRRLLSKGRAAGLTLVAATQRPSADVIPTAVRDLFALRIAHATATRESTEMILGSAWSAGPAHDLSIGHGHQGLAYVMAEGERSPSLARMWHVEPSIVRAVAERTAHNAPRIEGLSSQPAARGNEVKAEEPKACLDVVADAASIVTAPRPDTEAVISALAAAGRPLRATEVQELSSLPEGRCRRALRALAASQSIIETAFGWVLA